MKANKTFLLLYQVQYTQWRYLKLKLGYFNLQSRVFSTRHTVVNVGTHPIALFCWMLKEIGPFMSHEQCPEKISLFAPFMLRLGKCPSPLNVDVRTTRT